MCSKVKGLVEAAGRIVSALDPEVLDPEYAVELVEQFSKMEKIASAGKALAASKVESSGTWKATSDRSAAHFIARKTGDSVGQTINALKTAKHLQELPKTDKAFRSGEITSAQAAEITSAASLDPSSEANLLEVARTEGISGLREASLQVRAGAMADEIERAERLHRSRSLRSWTDPEGAVRLEARLAPEAGAEVKAVLEAYREKASRDSAEKPSFEASGADSLLLMARAAMGKEKKLPSKVISVRVDHSALERGHMEAGEICEIEGIGPIPVTSAKAMMVDSFIKVISLDGTDVRGVTHLGRTIPAKVKTALLERDRVCGIEGCRHSAILEIDHVLPVGDQGPTRLDNLVRLCSHHHRLKTHKGYGLIRDATAWKLLPP